MALQELPDVALSRVRVVVNDPGQFFPPENPVSNHCRLESGGEHADDDKGSSNGHPIHCGYGTP